MASKARETHEGAQAPAHEDPQPPTPITRRTGVKCTLRYMYTQKGNEPLLLECFRESSDRFWLSIGMDEGAAAVIDEVERELHSGTHVQYKPRCVDRHYYDTLQEACEGAVKTLRRRGDWE